MNQPKTFKTARMRWYLACGCWLSLTLLTIKAHAQDNSPNISLTVKEATLSAVLDQVAKQSGYSYIPFSPKLLQANPNIVQNEW